MDVCDIGFRSSDWHQETFADSSPARPSRACEARSSQWICSQCMRVEAKGHVDLYVSTVSTASSGRCTVETNLRLGRWRDSLEESLYSKTMEANSQLNVENSRMDQIESNPYHSMNSTSDACI
jgi:hypothetical protein